MLFRTDQYLRKFTVFGLCFSILLALPDTGAYCAGGLAVAPMRITFEGRHRNHEITLRNNDVETQVYRLSLIEMDMPEEGPLQILEKPEENRKSAKKMIRFSPRQVTLRPGQVQIVRVRVRRPAGLEDSEYRSHLLFQNVPQVGNRIERQLESQPTVGLQVNIVPVFGVAIPIIVRQGALNAEVALSDLQLTPATTARSAEKILSLLMERSGNRSVYGDLTVVHTLAGGGAVEVGRVNGVSVYTPGNRRRISIRLMPPPGRSLSAGTLSVVYRAKAEEGGELFADASIRLAQSVSSR